MSDRREKPGPAIPVFITDSDHPIGIQSLSGHKVTRATVGVAAVQLAATALTDRRAISVKAMPSNTGVVYIGHDDTVATSTGYPLKKGETYNADLSADATIWAIADTADQAVAVAEVGG